MSELKRARDTLEFKMIQPTAAGRTTEVETGVMLEAIRSLLRS